MSQWESQLEIPTWNSCIVEIVWCDDQSMSQYILLANRLRGRLVSCRTRQLKSRLETDETDETVIGLNWKVQNLRCRRAQLTFGRKYRLGSTSILSTCSLLISTQPRTLSTPSTGTPTLGSCFPATNTSDKQHALFGKAGNINRAKFKILLTAN